MSDPAIRIRVGAAVDRNIGNAFRPIIDAAKDARRQVEDEMDRLWAAVSGGGKRASKAGQGPYRSVVREAERAANQVVAAERRKQRQIESEERKATRRRESAERHVARIKDRHFAAQQREGERSDKLAARSAERSRKDNVGRLRGVAGGSVETLGKVGRGAVGVAGSIARGAGVQTDLGSYIGQSVELETRAGELSAAAYDEQRDKGKRIDPRELVSIARNVGKEAAFDPARVLEGLQSFVGKTGDLATGQAALPGLSKLARATGTSLEDMVGAAGEAAKALGDVGPGKDFETAADKGKALVNVLRLMAGQGKVGAAELKDMARYGGRLAAASQAFGGDAAQNMGDMGALAQLAIARGGAASAAEAATSVAGFANTLKTPARVKEFKAHGVDVYGKGGGFKSVRDILKESSASAVERGGTEAPIEFKKMFANVKGAQAADPAFQAYSKAFRDNLSVTKDKTKADQAGKAAIDELFDKFGKAISETEQNESFGRSMNTSAAKVQLFNNELSKIGGQIAERVLPQLQKLAPYVVSAAEAFAKFVSFAAENPGTAITGAIIASIGKAAIGSAVGTAVSKMVEGAAGSGGAMKGLSTLSIVASAITIASVGMLAIDTVMNEMDKGKTESVEKDLAAFDAIRGANKALSTTAPPGDVAAQEARKKEQEGALQKAIAEKASIDARLGTVEKGPTFFDTVFGNMSQKQLGMAESDASKLPQLLADQAKLAGAIEKLSAQLGRPLKVNGDVNVTNMPGAPGPVANTANTTK